MQGEPKTPLELWGGVECTVNRVGDRFHDQLRRNGHLARPEDIDSFAALGLQALRVPVLWELAGSVRDRDPDFSSFDPMLNRVRALGLRPIAGLVHHGSGPAFTDLLSPEFEHGLAAFALQVARRYPWIDSYTPVNEPLTTARFSALYGYWYPHTRDMRSFVRALLHETRGTVRAMRAIRSVQPAARLIQTEDIGKVFATPRLQYQADYENIRRWLSLDLLCGRVDREHPLYRHLLDHGAEEAELAWFVEQPCVPDIIGINYYFTSDRYLDEQVERHPAEAAGGNGRDAYADVCAVRVPGVGMVGHAAVLEATWERYRRPLAITEVHAGCTREEQLRWVHEAHGAAHDAIKAGVDVRALTAWSLLGSFDWSSLVRHENGVYEPGLFDLRSPRPRPTALATMFQALAKHGSFAHPVLSGRGWWRRHGPKRARSDADEPSERRGTEPARPLLIIGKRGTLGQAFAHACEQRGLCHELVERKQLDIAEPRAVAACLRALRPWAVINAAGYVRVDQAELEPMRCTRENTRGPAVLAETCRAQGVRLLTFSSDLVFDGQRREPYLEHHEVAPLSVYGRSKADAERCVLDALPDAMVVRTSAFFGPADAHNFVTVALRSLALGEPFTVLDDAVVSPTYTPHLVDACLDLLIDGAAGLWHLANVGAITWVELATQAAALAGLPASLVCPSFTAERPARRPSYSVLSSERASVMPTLEEGLARYFCDVASG